MTWINASPLRCIQRPMAPAAGALIVGIAMGAGLPGHLGSAGGGLLLCSAFTVRNILRSRPGVIWPFLFLALSGYIAIQPWLLDTLPDHHVIRFVGGQTWRISGRIVEQPRMNADRWRFLLAADDLNAGSQHHAASGRVLVSGRGHWPGAVTGDRVQFNASLHAIRNFANPGGFDYEHFMALQAVRTRAYAKSGSLKVVPDMANRGWRARLDRYRGQLAEQMAKVLMAYPGHTTGLLKAILLGDRDQLTPRIRQDFNRAGVGHVLAISGLHIGMVAMVAFAAAKWGLSWIPLMLRRGWVRKGAAVVSLGPVLGYGLLAGLSPSTQRAMIMVAVALMGYCLGRSHDWFNTLALAGLTILWVHPPAVFSISFQLSFMAVLAILCGPNRSPIESDAALLRRWLARLLALIRVSLLAAIGTLPLVLHYFNQVSIIGPAVNLVVVPLVGLVIVPAGLAGVGTTVLNADLAALLWHIAALGMEAVRITVQWAAQWPGSAIRWVTPTGFEMGLCYLLGAVFLFWKRFSRPKAALAVILILTCMDAGYWTYQRFGRQDLRVTAIDVGQGTANLLQFPGGTTALVDGGGFSDNAAFDVGALIVAPLLWRQKIATVDLVVLSHANSDHLNGLLYILENFKVREVWSNGQSSSTSAFREWERLITLHRVTHLDLNRLPAFTDIQGVRLEVLAPPRDFRQHSALEPWRDLNNNSLVLRASYRDIAFLFGGDIMAEAEAEMVARLGAQELRSTVLLVPHHGSRSSCSAPFLRAAQPKEAVISAGWGNRFGFPHSETLRRLETMGVRIWCTSEAGAIQVVTNGKKYHIKTCREYSPK